MAKSEIEQPELSDLGSWSLGPMLAGFTLWLSRRLEAAGIETVLFVSREGEYLLKAAESVGLTQRLLHIPCSRSLFNRMSINDDDFTKLLKRAPYRGTKENFLGGRFGLGDDEIAQLLAPHEYGEFFVLPEDLEVGLELSSRVRTNFRAQFGETRENFMAFFDALVPDKDQRFAVVDIGYLGTIQLQLQKVLGIRTTGFYLATETVAGLSEGLEREGWFSEDAVRGVDPILHEILILEILMQANLGQVIDYQSRDERIEVIRKPGHHKDSDLEKLAIIQQAGIDTMIELCQSGGDAAELDALGKDLTRALLRYNTLVPSEIRYGLAMDDQFSGRPDCASPQINEQAL